ncbi:MAG TPA: AI-2E family transporter [Gammaproteobacteria bacterium]
MTRVGSYEDRFRKFFVLLLVFAVAAAFINMIHGFLTALFLAAVFSALLYPLQRHTTHWFGGHERLAAVAVVIIALIAIGIPLLSMLGLVTAEAVSVSSKVAPWIKEQLQGTSPFTGDLPGWVPFAEELEPYRRTILEKAGQAVSAAGKFLVGSIPNLTQVTIGIALDAFIMIYAMFFFLVEGPEWLARAKNYVPLRSEDRDMIVERGFTVTRAALKGILVIGLLQGILVGLAFWAAGIQGAAFWGAIVLILSAIPGLGAALVWVPAALYLFITGETGWGIAMTAWGVVVVGLVDNILRPIVVGRDAKLPDLLILVSTLGGIVMFGAAGILVGPILAAMLVIVLDIYHAAFAQVLPADDEPQKPA